jgi:hypothetical protein
MNVWIGVDNTPLQQGRIGVKYGLDADTTPTTVAFGE